MVKEDDVRHVVITEGGPMMVQGPVRIEMANGEITESNRFMVAICTCRRSKIYPLCDTSHRERRRADRGSDELPT